LLSTTKVFGLTAPNYLGAFGGGSSMIGVVVDTKSPPFSA